MTIQEQMKQWNAALVNESETFAQKQAAEEAARIEAGTPRKKAKGYTLTDEQQVLLDELAHQMLKNFEHFTFEDVIRYGKLKSENLEHNRELIVLWARDWIEGLKAKGHIKEITPENSGYDYSTYIVQTVRI